MRQVPQNRARRMATEAFGLRLGTRIVPAVEGTAMAAVTKLKTRRGDFEITFLNSRFMR